ncbi:MAG: c-type cytochrome [Pirellulales bacterium]|nr:c-type cytochrome [Pirellulales bacterium]
MFAPPTRAGSGGTSMGVVATCASWREILVLAVWLLVFMPKVALWADLCGAADEDAASDDAGPLPQLARGLISEYATDADATGDGHPARVVRRVDPAIAFDWQRATPDVRWPAGPFRVHWRGLLGTQAAGRYRLHAFAGGSVVIRLAGKTVLEGSRAEPGWLASESLELEYGYQPLEIDYQSASGLARIALFWTGPGFGLEPVGEQYLFHDPATSPDTRFEHGRELVQALRCGACHVPPEAADLLPAPALDRVAGNFAPGWIAHWLASPRGAAPAARMPDLGLSDASARAIAAWLEEHSKPVAVASRSTATTETDVAESADEAESRSKKKSKSKPAEPEPPPTTLVERGLTLVHTLGCLACHQVGELGTRGAYDGGDLTRIADKRPADFFVRWLADPAAINAAHRMPVFRMNAAERDDVSAYLATLRGSDKAAKDNAAAAAAINDSPAARRIIEQSRCAACHQLPEGIAKPAVIEHPLTGASDWSASCLGEPRPSAGQPGYRLSADDAAAVRTYLAAVVPGAQQSAHDRGTSLLAQHNCLSCHARGGALGLAAQAPAIAAALPALGTSLGGLTPPPLDSVGDKLHEKALSAAIKLSHDPLRPWLSVRMPRFDFNDADVAQLVEHFVATDRIPEGAPAAEEGFSSRALTELAGESLVAPGARLVTSDGFGCVSCHQIGNVEPLRSEPGTRGVNLSLVGERVRSTWFERWVRNPARIVPRIEMPAVQQPVRGVSEDRLDVQLAAVWTVLNRPGFNPPEPNPVRVLRQRNIERQPGEPHASPVVVQDVFKFGDRKFVDPLVIGLANRHNILFDLETNRLAAWWIGDTARQRTKGKSWHWEPGGTLVAPLPDNENDDDALATSDILLVRGEEIVAPQRVGQSLVRLESYFDEAPGFRFRERLKFLLDDSVRCELEVMQSLMPESPAVEGDSSGFSRRVEVTGVPPGWQVVLRLWAGPGEVWPAPNEGQALRIGRALGSARAVVEDRQIESLAQASVEHVLRSTPDLQGAASFEVAYQSFAPVDQYLAPQSVEVPPIATKLGVVPGFEAIQLPLPTEIMPTSLAWRNGSELVFTSLKGQVYVARDEDNDHLEDRLELFADGLAAPYGIADSFGHAKQHAVDVIHKPGLVRLSDLNNDQVADTFEVLASGWGRTDDYHDWAVGLPGDGQGGYFAALPCQQDDRSPAEAFLRGRIVRLLPPPRGAAPRQPWTIEPYAAGLRFPMGLAVDRHGELFASDNQGNYNPFNELNHVEPAMRYGFINKLEARELAAAGVKPPEFRAAAIEIPHPWTRSVNGIAFLDTPPALRRQTGRDVFGPFEGHLIGCEYDTRRLIRMSLERVEGVYQGAAYPFSVPPATADAPTFEGPVACAVSPAGGLYVGNLRDSGWGAGANTGSIVRLRPTGQWPLGIAKVTIAPRGFTIHFTGPVDADRGASAENYAIESYRRISTPEYGGPDVDRRRETIRAVEFSTERLEARLELGKLRTDCVYEIRLRGLGPGGAALVPDEAHYTVRRVPSE